MKNTPQSPMGVTGVVCSCCGETVFVVNRATYAGEPLFCRRCMALPEEVAEALILDYERQIVAHLPGVNR